MFRNKLIYGMVLVLCIIYAVMYNEYSTMIFLLIFCFFPVVLLLFLIPMCFLIGVQGMPCKTVINKGEETEIPLIISNRFIFPVSMLKVKIVYYNEGEKKKYTSFYSFSLAGREVKRVVCKFSSSCCGNILVNVKSAVVYDYLKLFSFRRKINYNVKLAVLPEIYEMEPIKIDENTCSLFDSDIYSKSKKGDDPSEIFDIRQYREGDKFQRVHWKLSSKKGELMIKEFSLPISSAVVIMVEFYYRGKNKTVMEYLNALMETALSLSFTLMQQGYLHYIAFYDMQNKEYKRKKIQAEEDIFDAIEELLNIKPYANEFPVIPFQIALYDKEQYTHMFYISTEIRSELLKELENLNPETKLYAFCIENTRKKQKEEREKTYGININHVKESLETIVLDS